MSGFYLVFSPLGLAYPDEIVFHYFWISFIVLGIVTIGLFVWSVKKWNNMYLGIVEKEMNINLRKTNEKPEA
ncbi:hypothetical protein ABES25_02650 [Bacillus gobiensis]|uniref:hypothetical protein n=1 Tax=Bacillus gobiensis TaxID=1441095 RepID=UPI003D215901